MALGIAIKTHAYMGKIVSFVPPLHSPSQLSPPATPTPTLPPPLRRGKRSVVAEWRAELRRVRRRLRVVRWVWRERVGEGWSWNGRGVGVERGLTYGAMIDGR